MPWRAYVRASLATAGLARVASGAGAATAKRRLLTRSEVVRRATTSNTRHRIAIAAAHSESLASLSLAVCAASVSQLARILQALPNAACTESSARIDPSHVGFRDLEPGLSGAITISLQSRVEAKRAASAASIHRFGLDVTACIACDALGLPVASLRSHNTQGQHQSCSSPLRGGETL